MFKLKALFAMIILLSFKAAAQLPFQNEIYSESSIAIYDFKYGTNQRHLLRLYSPSNALPKPLLVLVNGSGFLSGAPLRDQNASRAKSYAKRGYAVIVIEYYRVPNPCPDFLKVVGEAAADVHAAIQFAIKHRSSININPNFIFIDGLSAGGIASTAAIWYGPQRFYQKFGISKNKNSLDSTISYTIKGISLESSGVLDLSVFNDADINTAASVFMSHALGDAVVPFKCGPSALCSKLKPEVNICGSGGIVESIKSLSRDNKRKNTCYLLHTYLTSNHSLGSSGPNMNTVLINNITAAFAWIISGKPCVQNFVFLNPVREDQELLSSEGSDEYLIKHHNDQFSFQEINENAINTFKVIDLYGNQYINQNITQESTINTKTLSSGIYIAILQIDNKIITKKLIIER